MTIGVYSSFNATPTWVSSTIPRPKAKRAALSMVNAIANCTHLFTSYLYPDSNKSKFLKAVLILAAFCGICALTELGLRTYLQRENRRIDREEGFAPGSSEEVGVGGRRRGFRYVL